MANAENVIIYLYGKRYRVPGNLTIMKAIEYAGYELTTGVGCRHGFCGACATIYRIRGERQLHYCLACETKIQDHMYIATLPYFPLEKQRYDIDKITPDESIMMSLYPEIYACVSCNTCTNTCTQGLDVMGYIHDAQNGDFKACAEKSFDCIMCKCCSTRCPAGISHSEVAMLARRINGKYIAPKCQPLIDRVEEVNRGELLDDVRELMNKPLEEVQELYNAREIEK
ncbi:MAG: 4Fe-4S ferredoxin [Clostridia bacterium]|nr:4Fe-4S ferredoxin [Clostridia bacterium]